MKRVLVGVKSIQRDADGHDTVIEMVSPGEYHEKNDTKYIMYNETDYPEWKAPIQRLS